MDAETEFFLGLMELQYGKQVEGKLKKLSQDVPWAEGWPKDNKAFWNAESFMWGKKIEKEKRELIKEELHFLDKRMNKNLDLGCGAYSYLPSIGLDVSEKMLQLNDTCTEKVVGNLEEKLPFKDNQFNSVTAVFVLNYVKNYGQLLSETKRILKKNGVFMMILGAKGVNDWQKQKEVNDFSAEKWKGILERSGFDVKFYEKSGLWFFKCGPIKKAGLLRNYLTLWHASELWRKSASK